MNLQNCADVIAREAVAAINKFGLRRPPEGAIERIETECIEKIAALYVQNSTSIESSVHAASATYRAIRAEGRAEGLEEQLFSIFSDIHLIETTDASNVHEVQAVLVKLKEKRRSYISIAVKYGQSIEAKQKASAGGKKRQEKSALVKAFAIQEYDSKKWRSTRQARTTLWPAVQAEANRVGWAMTPTQGPETLYQWLLEHKKVPCQPADLPL